MVKRILPYIVLAAVMADSAWSQGDKMSHTESVYVQNMAALKNAGRHDIPVLLATLTDPSACQGMNPMQEQTYLNEVMNTLGRMDDPEMELESALVQLVGDTTRNPGVREYALQHLGLRYKNSRNKETILSTLYQYASSDDVFATALLQLHRLDRKGLASIDNSYSELLVRAATKENLRISDQVTLLSLINAYKVVEALPTVRMWLSESKAPIVVHGAAEVLKRYGDQNDLEFVQAHVMNRKADDVQNHKNSPSGHE